MKKLPRVFPRKPRVTTPPHPDLPESQNSSIVAEHPARVDNRAVDNFAYAMRVKLAVKRQEGRGGWQDKEQCSNEFLSKLLREHVEKGDPVDVANFAMMIHQRGERILSATSRTTEQFALRKRIMFAIFDPGASEGFKGDRDLTTWQTDAVMKVISEDAGLTVEKAWQELCETSDITSPEEYPDHALITMEQLGDYMRRARACEAENA